MKDKYEATVKLEKMQYELLRQRYGKRITIGAQKLVEMALAEIIRDQAAKLLEGEPPIGS